MIAAIALNDRVLMVACLSLLVGDILAGRPLSLYDQVTSLDRAHTCEGA